MDLDVYFIKRLRSTIQEKFEELPDDKDVDDDDDNDEGIKEEDVIDDTDEGMFTFWLALPINNWLWNRSSKSDWLADNIESFRLFVGVGELLFALALVSIFLSWSINSNSRLLKLVTIVCHLKSENKL